MKTAGTGRKGVPDLVGTRLGGCRIEALLGSGGMGSVYRAHHLALDKKVALKLLAPFLAGDEEYVARFVSEARAAAKLEHANIVQVLNVGREGERYYIVMQYVDGESLQQVLRREKRLPPDRALRIMRHVTSGLAAAHRGGIIHRDIKPANILIGRDGVSRIADFGLARRLRRDTGQTSHGTFMGTPEYASPEQVMGREVGPRSDLYSLGVTWYRTLTGSVPFEGKNAVEVATKQAQEEAPSLSSRVSGIPSAMEALVHRLLDKDPARRGEGARELLRELSELGGKTRKADKPLVRIEREADEPETETHAVAATDGGAPPSTSTMSRGRRRPLRHSVAWLLVLSGLGLLFLVGAGGGIHAGEGLWERMAAPFSGREDGNPTPVVLTVVGLACLVSAVLVNRRAFKRAAHPRLAVLFLLVAGACAYLSGIDAPAADPDRASADQLLLGALRAWPDPVQAFPAALGLLVLALTFGWRRETSGGQRWMARLLVLVSAGLVFFFSASSGGGTAAGAIGSIGGNLVPDVPALAGLLCLAVGIFVAFRPERSAGAVGLGGLLLGIGLCGAYMLGRLSGAGEEEGMDQRLLLPLREAGIGFREHVGMMTVTLFLLGWAARFKYASPETLEE